ncbi:hypothetical protein LSH36_278g02091 [Paralvinella palmiformis]|uniref:Transmembrane protein 43 n=1 Tax=Paralvinella palmiformis TaxID=53620 RepID=A0AAD9JJ90_9ANNE|nr:hypothetical protein LSH36_278g02091 [Paralvinella palmiformis]
MYRQHFPDDPGMHNMPRTYNSRTPSYRRQHNLSVWHHIKRSFVTFVIGNLLLSIAAVLVFWNEGRAVQTSQSLDEGLHIVRILKSAEVIFDENNGKLVHLSGTLKTSKLLYDEDYSVSVAAVKLRRRVEMYQWIETEERRDVRDGDSVQEEVSYSYSAEWRSDLTRSTSFNSRLHNNPDKFPVEAKIYIADDVQVGNFFLTQNLIEKVTNFHDLHLTEPAKNVNVKLYGGLYYHGKDPLHPEIGDMRVIFDYAGLSGPEDSKLGPPDVVSILAKQSGSQLIAYQTETGDELQLLYNGHHSAESMIGYEKMTNSLILWALRFVGWLLMFIGFGCLSGFLHNMVDRVPILHEVVSLGTVSFSLTFSISLSLIVIAASWIWYRPYLGISIMAMAIIPLITFHIRYQRSRAYRPV